MRLGKRRLVGLVGPLAALLIVSVPSVSAQSTGDWSPGPGGILENTYSGVIDTPSNASSVPGGGAFTVGGWFVDRAAQGWAGADDVQVWLGTMDGGGQLLAKGSVAQSRPDVAAALGNPFAEASGFSAVVNGGSVPGGTQTLSVYLHTGGKGWWFKTLSVTGGGTAAAAASAPAMSAPAASASTGAPVLTISTPTEGENVSTTKTDYTINGSVSDAGNIDSIEVWINGERDSGRLIGTTTPSSDGSWSLTFKPTRFASTHSNLFVYAHNSASRQETQVIRGFNIVDKK